MGMSLLLLLLQVDLFEVLYRCAKVLGDQVYQHCMDAQVRLLNSLFATYHNTLLILCDSGCCSAVRLMRVVTRMCSKQ